MAERCHRPADRCCKVARGRARRRARCSTTSTSRSTRGARTVILGANGAGKSVLLRVLHGLHRARRRARSPGADATPRPRGQAMVFQRAGAAAPLGARQHRVRAATVPACAAPKRRRAHRRSAARVGFAQLAQRAGARALRRRAAAPRARARLGAAARRAVPRRAHREPRPGADARRRGDHARDPRARHDDRHDHAQPRAGEAPRRRDRLPARRPRRPNARPRSISSRAAHRRKRRHSSKENCL